MILGGGTVDITAISRTAFGTTVHVPYVSLAATDGTHKVVIDTGAREVDVVKKPHAHRWPEEEMENVLRACMGWSLEDVDTVINTHLHYDQRQLLCTAPGVGGGLESLPLRGGLLRLRGFLQNPHPILPLAFCRR